MKLYLNLGSGIDYRRSDPSADIVWVNIDSNPAVRADRHDIDICRLDQWFKGQADYIEAQDILEHIPYSDDNQTLWKKALHSWVKCLKPGGRIRVQVPSPDAIWQRFNGGMSEYDLNRVIYGESTGTWDRHYQLFTLSRIAEAMAAEGLLILDASILNVCAVVVAVKPETGQ